MSVGNLGTYGGKKDNFPFQLRTLEVLGQIKAAIQAAGTASTLRVTSYEASITNGSCYTIGDFITRTDIISVPSGTITATIWFDETKGTQLTGACIPPIGNLNPYIPPSSVTVSNLPAGLGQETMAGSLAVVIASNQSAIPISLPSGTQTITSVFTGTGGTISSGATSIGFTTDPTFTGNINGVARASSTFYGFTAAEGKTLPAIVYTVTTGNITIDIII